MEIEVKDRKTLDELLDKLPSKDAKYQALLGFVGVVDISPDEVNEAVDYLLAQHSKGKNFFFWGTAAAYYAKAGFVDEAIDMYVDVPLPCTAVKLASKFGKNERANEIGEKFLNDEDYLREDFLRIIELIEIAELLGMDEKKKELVRSYVERFKWNGRTGQPEFADAIKTAQKYGDEELAREIAQEGVEYYKRMAEAEKRKGYELGEASNTSYAGVMAFLGGFYDEAITLLKNCESNKEILAGAYEKEGLIEESINTFLQIARHEEAVRVAMENGREATARKIAEEQARKSADYGHFLASANILRKAGLNEEADVYAAINQGPTNDVNIRKELGLES